MTLCEKQLSDSFCVNWLYSHWISDNRVCKSVSFITKHMGYHNDCRFISPCWCLYRFFRKRETKHSEVLNKAYDELKKLRVLEDDKHYVSLNIINKKIEDIQYFQQATQHLKSYKEIFKTWNNTDKLQKEFNELLEELEPLLRDRIREKAREPENYPNHIAIFEKPNADMKNQNCYSMALMMNDIFDYLYSAEQEGMLLGDYVYYEKNIDNSYLLTHQDQTIVIESKSESDSKRDKLIKFMESVVDDGNLRQKFDNLRVLRRDLDEAVKSFRLQIKELSDDIDLGHIIRGKCRLGY
jgi:hypothetical protein